MLAHTRTDVVMSTEPAAIDLNLDRGYKAMHKSQSG